MIDWEDDYYPLTAFATGRNATGGDLKIAQEGFELFCVQREERIRKLSKLVYNFGIDLDFSEQSLASLNRFYSSGIERHETKGQIAYEWAEVTLDIGVYIGEVIRKKWPVFRWALLEEEDPIHPFFHDIGLTSGPLKAPLFSVLFTYARNMIEDDLKFESLAESQFEMMVQDLRKLLL
ncbi:MAG: hypothetical protein AAF382_16455 [Pseudomonadota bacterium]